MIVEDAVAARKACSVEDSVLVLDFSRMGVAGDVKAEVILVLAESWWDSR